MNCETLAAHLTDFLEGDLSEEEEMAALEHLASCNACEIVLAETRGVTYLVREIGRAPLSEEDRSRMLFGLLRELD